MSNPSQLQYHRNIYSLCYGGNRPIRITRFLIIALLLLYALRSLSFEHLSPFTTSEIDASEASLYKYETITRLRHIPPKIWQIYFSPGATHKYSDNIRSWIASSPSYSYTIIDTSGALAIIDNVPRSRARGQILEAFHAMSRRVMRADFLRYLILAVEGGIYSDIDTTLEKSLHDWVPEEFRNQTKLIVGIEGDASPPIPGMTYEVQFCQWTLASTAGHPALWTMVERITSRVLENSEGNTSQSAEYTNEDVLGITGPAAWTEVIFDYLGFAVGSQITWQNLTGMREPRLYGDVLVLPIDGFASGLPHSGSTDGQGTALVKHQQHGSWKEDPQGDHI